MTRRRAASNYQNKRFKPGERLWVTIGKNCSKCNAWIPGGVLMKFGNPAMHICRACGSMEQLQVRREE